MVDGTFKHPDFTLVHVLCPSFSGPCPAPRTPLHLVVTVPETRPFADPQGPRTSSRNNDFLLLRSPPVSSSPSPVYCLTRSLKSHKGHVCAYNYSKCFVMNLIRYSKKELLTSRTGHLDWKTGRPPDTGYETERTVSRNVWYTLVLPGQTQDSRHPLSHRPGIRLSHALPTESGTLDDIVLRYSFDPPNICCLSIKTGKTSTPQVPVPRPSRSPTSPGRRILPRLFEGSRRKCSRNWGKYARGGSTGVWRVSGVDVHGSGTSNPKL